MIMVTQGKFHCWFYYYLHSYWQYYDDYCYSYSKPILLIPCASHLICRYFIRAVRDGVQVGSVLLAVGISQQHY
jgi:hypothetical protein